MKISLFILVFIFVNVATMVSQTNEANGIVQKLLQDIANGKIEKAKESLPELSKRFPKESAVLYLQATCTNSTDEAIVLFSEIVLLYPLSPFADDALFSLLQLAVVEKADIRAKEYFTKLQEDYSYSSYIVPAYNLLRLTGEITANPIAVRGDEQKPVIEEKTSTTQSMFPKKNTGSTNIPKKPTETKVTEVASKTESNTPSNISANKTPISPKETSVKKSTTVKSTTTTTTTKTVINSNLYSKPKENKAPNVETNKSITKEINPLKGFYFLQAGSFKNKEAAQRQLLKFKPMRRRILERKIGNQTHYVIALGKYSSRDSADKAKITVDKQCKCQTFIINE